MSELVHDRRFEPRYGEAVTVAPGVRRITAANPGPFTFHGTNTYLVGDRRLAVVDPGPDDPAHIAAILRAVGSSEVAAILVTHTHSDHSPAAPRLAALTGAPTFGEGPHRPARPLREGEIVPFDDAADTAFVPDRRLVDGEVVAEDDWGLEAVATPGHCANHLAFALAGTSLLLSGDHVMAWSTTIVAPPDGAMVDYMASLARLAARPETRYLPAHGGPVEEGHAHVAALAGHRRKREAGILDRIAAGDDTVAAIVAVLYRDVDPGLHAAAALSVMAHLEDLAGRGVVAVDGPLSPSARLRLA